ncbi:carbamate kinase [Kribbella sp. NBC_00382]|uniref:carbamate kinase n=1 Tax=Kribbella sp. NBC_00382 TaxID=2975967 RepID=UPI002E1F6353
MRIVIALGGNALLRRGEPPDAAVQLAHLEAAAPALAKIAADHEVVIVHGNGPQVGLLALESLADHALSRSYPLSDLVAETQGMIGYWIQQTLANAGLTKPVITLVTQTVVDSNDPAFAEPSKFIGAGYPEAEARKLAGQNSWTVHQDGNSWRRVVASPSPRRVVELETAQTLLQHRTTVVLAGGGGIPVTEGPSGRHGIDAVVDKDLTAALIATDLKADLLVMLTDVKAVFLDFGTPSERPLHHITLADLTDLTFPPGSMGPKVAAARQFVQDTHGRAAIGSLDDATTVIAGSTGTQLTAA